MRFPGRCASQYRAAATAPMITTAIWAPYQPASTRWSLDATKRPAPMLTATPPTASAARARAPPSDARRSRGGARESGVAAIVEAALVLNGSLLRRVGPRRFAAVVWPAGPAWNLGKSAWVPQGSVGSGHIVSVW